ncbi:MAG: multi-sensor signal transduction histidine kinase [Actinomycetia bacterium]|nr:multi-sensor signal transduction histidine kinase [Actinomycetes bacterium]
MNNVGVSDLKAHLAAQATAGLIVIGAVFAVVNRHSALLDSVDGPNTLHICGQLVLAAMFAAVGWLLATRRPEVVFGWIALAAAIGHGLSAAGTGWAVFALTTRTRRTVQDRRAGARASHHHRGSSVMTVAATSTQTATAIAMGHAAQADMAAAASCRTTRAMVRRPGTATRTLGLSPGVPNRVGKPMRTTTEATASTMEWPASAHGVATQAMSSVANLSAEAAPGRFGDPGVSDIGSSTFVPTGREAPAAVPRDPRVWTWQWSR